MKPKVLKIVAVGALVLSLGTAASADLLSIPSMIPDVCFFGSCVQFTQSSALANIQHVIGQIQQLKNEAQNLATLPTSLPAAQAEISAVLGTGKTIAAEVQADAAAQTISDQAEQDAAEAARLNGLATNALGANQQATVQNGMLSQLVVTQQKSLDLQATQQNQDAQARADFAQSLSSAWTAPNVDQPL